MVNFIEAQKAFNEYFEKNKQEIDRYYREMAALEMSQGDMDPKLWLACMNDTELRYAPTMNKFRVLDETCKVEYRAVKNTMSKNPEPYGAILDYDHPDSVHRIAEFDGDVERVQKDSDKRYLEDSVHHPKEKALG